VQVQDGYYSCFAFYIRGEEVTVTRTGDGALNKLTKSKRTNNWESPVLTCASAPKRLNGFRTNMVSVLN
jgi:hypothetical protein